MTKRRLILAKVTWLTAICIGVAFFSAINSQALRSFEPNASVTFNGGSFGVYRTDYEFRADNINSGDWSEVFCIENAITDSGVLYELIDVSEYNHNGVTNAAGIASQFFSGMSWTKRATQIAIWEVVFDFGSGWDLGQGVFQLNSELTADEVADLAEIQNYIGSNIASSTKIVRSPPGSNPPLKSQDYLISVPDTSIMFLLGPALIGLGLLGRRKSKK